MGPHLSRFEPDRRIDHIRLGEQVVLCDLRIHSIQIDDVIHQMDHRHKEGNL